jgi:hypothetical protein
MNAVPRARAANAKQFLEFLEGFRPGTAVELRSALAPEIMAAVLGSARTDWNGLKVDGPFVTAIVSCLGVDQARTAWRRFADEQFIHMRAIRAIFDGAQRLFGLSVGALVRVAPLAFQQGFRDFGEMRVAVSDRHATIEIAVVPEVLPHLEAYAVLFHGMFLGMYDIVGVEPELDFQVSGSDRKIVAAFRW